MSDKEIKILEKHLQALGSEYWRIRLLLEHEKRIKTKAVDNYALAA